MLVIDVGGISFSFLVPAAVAVVLKILGVIAPFVLLCCRFCAMIVDVHFREECFGGSERPRRGFRFLLGDVRWWLRWFQGCPGTKTEDELGRN